MKELRTLSTVVVICLATLLGLSAAAQASFTVYEGTSLTDVSLFGNLNQYDSTITDAYGNYGCQVTAYTNALVYLQKAYPSINGTNLVSNYSALANTALTLGGANYLNVQVTKVNGTITSASSNFRDQVWGMYTYINEKVPGQTSYAAQMIPVPNQVGGNPPGGWTTARYQPAWVSMNASYPTESFLYNALSNHQGLVIDWNQFSVGKSHLLTITGLTWDSSTNNGTLYFIDPVGGKQHNSPFFQAPDGSLWMDYGEYSPGNPWKKADGVTNWWYSGNVRITLAMAEGPAPTPLPSALLLLGSGLLGLGSWRRFRRN